MLFTGLGRFASIKTLPSVLDAWTSAVHSRPWAKFFSIWTYWSVNNLYISYILFGWKQSFYHTQKHGNLLLMKFPLRLFIKAIKQITTSLSAVLNTLSISLYNAIFNLFLCSSNIPCV